MGWYFYRSCWSRHGWLKLESEVYTSHCDNRHILQYDQRKTKLIAIHKFYDNCLSAYMSPLTPYGATGHDEHWMRYLLLIWRDQSNTWIGVDLTSVRSSDIHRNSVSMGIPKISINNNVNEKCVRRLATIFLGNQLINISPIAITEVLQCDVCWNLLAHCSLSTSSIDSIKEIVLLSTVVTSGFSTHTHYLLHISTSTERSVLHIIWVNVTKNIQAAPTIFDCHF